jgi:hypothetical protein
MKIKGHDIKEIPLVLSRRIYFQGEFFVKKPTKLEAVISDLFIWRSDNLFQTYFELLDIYGLISCDLDKSSNRSSVFVFFNKNGDYLFEREIFGNDFARNTILIKDLLDREKLDNRQLGDYGTFAVFHSIDKPIDYESSLSDRGYCGYEYLESNFRGYVHGNFDAITRVGNDFELLMGYGRLKRPYNVQHILTGPSAYEIALVNPTDKVQNVLLKVNYSEQKNVEQYQIPSRGVRIIPIKTNRDDKIRVKIVSQMYMARPIVFRHDLNSFDVFHG